MTFLRANPQNLGLSRSTESPAPHEDADLGCDPSINNDATPSSGEVRGEDDAFLSVSGRSRFHLGRVPRALSSSPLSVESQEVARIGEILFLFEKLLAKSCCHPIRSSFRAIPITPSPPGIPTVPALWTGRGPVIKEGLAGDWNGAGRDHPRW